MTKRGRWPGRGDWLTGLTATVAALACAWLGPWWCVAAPSVAIGFVSPSLRRAIVAGALSAAAAWMAVAFFYDLRSGGRLSARIGGILQAPAAPLAAYFATGLVAALVASLAAWSGFSLREVFWPSPRIRSARRSRAR